MLFNSYIFILFFLPFTMLGYFMLGKINKAYPRQIFLLVMSLVFYGYNNPYYLLVILGSVGINYLAFYMLGRPWKKQNSRKAILVLALISNIGVLVVFKYLDFFATNINIVLKTQIPLLELALPLGISFFTFQQIAFIVDAYRREVSKCDFLTYANFITFFPQLIAGPIVSHDEIIPQLVKRENSLPQWDNISSGIYIFVLGLSKKVIIADSMGNAVNYAFEKLGGLNVWSTIVTVFAYSFEIYFDFSGYCDMAMGIAKMFNIDLPLNFNSPYKAHSIGEFWDRWHLTLTRFLTKYIYIPLGGSRKGAIRTYINVMVVFLISGFWHGANWTFVLWGLVNGLLIVIEKISTKWIKKSKKLWSQLLTFIVVTILWALFRSPSIEGFGKLLTGLGNFSGGGVDVQLLECFCPYEILQMRAHLGGNIFSAVFVVVLFAIALYFSMFAKNSYERMKAFKPSVKNVIVTIVLLLWCILDISKTSTFLYFNF